MSIFEKYPKPAMVNTDPACWHGIVIPDGAKDSDHCLKCKKEWEESERQVEETFVGKPYDPDTQGYGL